MGFLKNLISDAVSEGVGKGIQSAVGKAVESAVRPAADKWAGQAANQIDQAAKDLAESTEAARAASGAAAGAFSETAATPAGAPGTGAASLGAALTGWATAMQGMAGQVAQNMKECPNCGEMATADNKFCPRCGAPLPEETVGAGNLCPKCGKQNVPGTTFCVECGTRLPAAEKALAAQLAKWDALLPQYPKWTLGGEIDLYEGDRINGYPSVNLSASGVGRAELARYVELLRADGFVPVYSGDSDFYYKMVDGVCRAFDKTDADAGGGVNVTFFVGDFDKRAAAKEPANASIGMAKDTAKAAADAAKGLFKKLF